MGLLVDQDGVVAANLSVRTWRVTTAVRAFALALCVGLVLPTGQEDAAGSGQLLLALLLIAGICSALEWGVLVRTTAWIPVVEALLVSLILTAGNADPGLFAYLAVPPVVAGVRHGPVTVLNAAFIGAVSLVLVPASSSASLRAETALPWIVVGLGAGALATWQSRASRELHARQAPFAAAHQLMSDLHRLAHEGAVGLDSATLAAEVATVLRTATGAAESAVFGVSRGGGLHLLESHGGDHDLAAQVMAPKSERRTEVAVVPLPGADSPRGFVALGHVKHWDEVHGDRSAEVASEFSLRLDTAILFEDIRHMATSEERNRIAREMHDGVAQEIVALGYIVDEIESVVTEPATKQLAANLRREISRVVTELRYSIFDLRQQVSEHRLAGALAEYVRQISNDSDLRVHLLLEESDHSPGASVETELLRVAQEAIGNVRRHACAENLWISYSSDGSTIELTIEDDGVGNAMPKKFHWGLQTMSERAAAIGASLTVEPRVGGGTTVRLHSRGPVTTEGSR